MSVRIKPDISMLPTEVLWNIFSFLPATEVVKNRAVCDRWQQVIDGYPKWQNFCAKDFADTYKTAHRKSPSLSWFDLYKSLYLWSHLKSAEQEVQDCILPDKSKIYDFEIIDETTARILQNGLVAYYDLQTWQKVERKALIGYFLIYKENEYIVAAINRSLQLFIAKANIPFVVVLPWHVCHLSLIGPKLYCLLDRSIRVCEFIDNELDIRDCSVRIPEKCEAVTSSYGYLSILTCNGNIFMLLNQKLVHVTSVADESNFIQKLYEFNCLDNLRCILYRWFRPYSENYTVTARVTVLAYGEIIFVGVHSGVLSIFYVPETIVLGELDVFTSPPLLRFNLKEMFDLQEWECEVIKIDVIEKENGHRVMVAMANRVISITFIHKFQNLSEAIRSGEDQNVTFAATGN